MTVGPDDPAQGEAPPSNEHEGPNRAAALPVGPAQQPDPPRGGSDNDVTNWEYRDPPPYTTGDESPPTA